MKLYLFFYLYSRIYATKEGGPDLIILSELKKMPTPQQRALAEMALEIRGNIFADPEGKERYKAWLANRKAALANQKGAKGAKGA